MTIIELAIHDTTYHWAERVQVQVPFNTFRQAAQILDHPDTRANAAARVFCSPPIQIEMVMKDRNELSKEISQALTTLMIGVLSKKDTIMGYPIKKE